MLCKNNIKILKLLGEEVFDFSHNYMIVKNVRVMKESLNGEFTSIYYLCEFIQNIVRECRC